MEMDVTPIEHNIHNAASTVLDPFVISLLLLPLHAVLNGLCSLCLAKAKSLHLLLEYNPLFYIRVVFLNIQESVG